MKRINIEELYKNIGNFENTEPMIIESQGRDIGIFCNMDNYKKFKPRKKSTLKEKEEYKITKIMNDILIDYINTKENFSTNLILNDSRLSKESFSLKERLNSISTLLEHYKDKGYIRREYRGQYKVLNRLELVRDKLDKDDIESLKIKIQDAIEHVSSERYTITCLDISEYVLKYLYHYYIDLYNLVTKYYGDTKLHNLIRRQLKAGGHEHISRGRYKINLSRV
jgi:hypothetical protein